MSTERRVVYVVGVGNEGAESLTPQARAIVEKAELLVGGQRLLDCFPGVSAERLRIGARVDDVLATLAARRASRRVVVLATGTRIASGSRARCSGTSPPRISRSFPT